MQVAWQGQAGIAKKWSSLHPDWQKIIKPCKFHGNVYCQLVENDIGLLIFYSVLPTPESTVIPKQISQAEEEQEVKETEKEFQEAEERLESSGMLDIAKFKADNITKVESLDIENKDLDP